MTKAKIQIQTKEKDNSISFNDISQVVNQNHEALSQVIYRNKDRVKNLGKTQDSYYGSYFIRISEINL